MSNPAQVSPSARIADQSVVRRRRLLSLVIATLCASVSTPLVSAPALADPTVTYTDGTTTYYTVPSDAVGVAFVVAGSVAESKGSDAGSPGRGAIMTGFLPAPPGTVIQVDPNYDLEGSGGASFGGGGGARGGASSKLGDQYGQPLVVAGGGGGGGDLQGGGSGGDAGTLASGNNGMPGQSPLANLAGGCQTAGGGGGSQTAGGSAGGGVCATSGTAGSLSVGGDGGSAPGGGGGGGGGAGYFGGGGGGGGFAGAPGGGGGGGSSWAAASVVAPSAAGFNNGAGYITLTPVTQAVAQQLAPTGDPSSTCKTNGGTVVFDATNAGVHTLLYTYDPSPAEPGNVDVCFRVESGGTGVGGMFEVTPTEPTIDVSGVTPPTVTPPTVTPPTVGSLPTTDNHAGYCASPPAGSAPDVLSTPHPLSSGTLAGGVTWMIDAYTDGASTAWLCFGVGTLVSSRVVVSLPTLMVTPPSVTPPSVETPSVGVTPGIDVTFAPDAGTP
jgi:hypothetical protein